VNSIDKTINKHNRPV